MHHVELVKVIWIWKGQGDRHHKTKKGDLARWSMTHVVWPGLASGIRASIWAPLKNHQREPPHDNCSDSNTVCLCQCCVCWRCSDIWCSTLFWRRLCLGVIRQVGLSPPIAPHSISQTASFDRSHSDPGHNDIAKWTQHKNEVWGKKWGGKQTGAVYMCAIVG